MPPLQIAGIEKMQLNGIDCHSFSKSLIDLIPEALCILDLDKTITFVNEKTLNILGVDSPYAYLGKNLLEFIAPENRRDVQDALDRVLENRIGSFSEYQMLHSDGRRVPVLAASSLITNINNEPIGYICVGHNPQAIAENLRYTCVSSSRTLLYQDLMSHDISNQLQVILSAAELLLYKLEGSEQESLLWNIIQSVSKCNRVIESSEIMENIMKIDLQERSLRQAVHNALLQVVKQQDVEIKASLQLDEAYILADVFLEQLLFAIFDNACTHNPNPDRIIWVSTAETGNGYSVIISDNGPGISDDKKMQLLRMEQRSAGLGLHICRLITDKYGATISISDRVEGSSKLGTKVEIWFPKIF